jgi:histidine ammonia-lyase
MAMGAAWKARRVLENVRNVIAIELMCAAQAVDYRAPVMPGRGVRRAHSVVRSIVSSLDGDRVMTPDIEALSLAIAEGRLDPEPE